MAGSGVAPDVHRVDLLAHQGWRLDTRFIQVFFAERVKTGPCQSTAALVNKQEVAVGIASYSTFRFYIGAKEGRCRIPQRHGAGLFPFAVKQYLLVGKVEVAQPDAAQFGGTGSGIIQGAENAEITVTIVSLRADAGENRIAPRFCPGIQRANAGSFSRESSGFDGRGSDSGAPPNPPF